jgi:CheY-like chemotaxis protein
LPNTRPKTCNIHVSPAHLSRRYGAPPLALVVDDNAVNQLVAAGLLQMLASTCRPATTGLQALASCRRRAPDFVLM